MAEKNIEKLAKIGEEYLRIDFYKKMEDLSLEFILYQKRLTLPSNSRIPSKEDVLTKLNNTKIPYELLINIGVNMKEYESQIKNIEEKLN
jgi:hypothetical protein